MVVFESFLIVMCLLLIGCLVLNEYISWVLFMNCMSNYITFEFIIIRMKYKII